MPSLSRRRLLRAVGGAAALCTAGCTTLPFAFARPNPEYELMVSTVTHEQPMPFVDRFRWEPITDAFAPQERAIVERLVETGSATTVGYHLGVGAHVDERAVWPPQYVLSDGMYYRICLASAREIEREATVFWLDLLDAAPGDRDAATVVTAPPERLSPQDRAVFDDVVDWVAVGHGPRDADSESPRHRGYVYDLYDPADSDLVPTPPFDYYRYDTDDGASRYFVPRVSDPTITRTQYEYDIEAVDSSRSAFESHMLETVIAAEFTGDDLSAETVAILDDLTTHDPGEPSNESHAEREPVSAGYGALLERLGLAVVELESEPIVSSEPVFFTYEGERYDGHLTISR